MNKEESQIKHDFYFPKLDGLRFLAFLLVYIHHSTPANFKPMAILHDRGWWGVELFFVLSSFLLTRLLVEEIKTRSSVSIAKFFIRRILRIWPLYFMYIFLVVTIFGLPQVITNQTVGRLIGLFTFSDNIWSSVFGYNTVLLIVNHLWTISLEEQYYLILPFIMPFLVKLNKEKLLIVGIAILCIFLICRSIAVLLGFAHPFIWVLPIQGDALLFGTLYGLGLFDNALNKVNSVIKLVVGSTLIITTIAFPNIDILGYSQIVSYTFIAIGFLLIVDGVLKNRSRWSELVFGNIFARYFGKITYGLYIYHLLCIYFVEILLKRIPVIDGYSSKWSISFICTLFCIIAVSSLSYEFYEKFFIKLKTRKYSVIMSRPV